MLSARSNVNIVSVNSSRLSHDLGNLIPSRSISGLIGAVRTGARNRSRTTANTTTDGLSLCRIGSACCSTLNYGSRRCLTTHTIRFFLPNIPRICCINTLTNHGSVRLLHHAGGNHSVGHRCCSATRVSRGLRHPIIGTLGTLTGFHGRLPTFSNRFDCRISNSASVAFH